MESIISAPYYCQYWNKWTVIELSGKKSYVALLFLADQRLTHQTNLNSVGSSVTLVQRSDTDHVDLQTFIQKYPQYSHLIYIYIYLCIYLYIYIHTHYNQCVFLIPHHLVDCTKLIRIKGTNSGYLISAAKSRKPNGSKRNPLHSTSLTKSAVSLESEPKMLKNIIYTRHTGQGRKGRRDMKNQSCTIKAQFKTRQQIPSIPVKTVTKRRM